MHKKDMTGCLDTFNVPVLFMNTHLFAVRIETLGCRLNQVESESFAALCAKVGFAVYTGKNPLPVRFQSPSVASLQNSNQLLLKPVENIQPKQKNTDAAVLLCFVNTCTVTGKAEQKARRLIRLLAKEHPDAAILVTGCYAQLEAAEVEALHPHVLAFPGQQKDALTALPHFLAACTKSAATVNTALVLSFLAGYRTEIAENGVHTGGSTAAPLSKTEAARFSLSTPQFLFHSRAFIKVQDGCNNACAYCRIRLARGKAVSLPSDEVVRRIQTIEQAGIAEVTLSGVNLSQYTCRNGDFSDLLKILLRETGIRIRISSLYPDRIDEALLPLLAHPQICPHFHLSVQSGSNAVLRAMRRSYTQNTITAAVSNLRKIKDNPFIGVDIITGFPGETDADFEETFKLCSQLHFAGIHAFPFSARPGTEAWDMKPKIPQRITKERLERLHNLAQTEEQRYYAAWEGKIVYAVAETPQYGSCFVTTENYLSLPLKSETAYKGGEYLRVRIRNRFAEPVADTP